MYAPPRSLSGDDLPELVRLVGGQARAVKLLAISERTFRRWHRERNVPLMVLRLLWYAGPYGRAEAEADMHFELKLRALHAENATAQRDQLAAALETMRQIVFQVEAANEELRQMFRDAGLTRELWSMRERLDELLGKTNTAEVVRLPTIATGTEGKS